MEERTGTQRQTSNGKNNLQVIRPVKQIPLRSYFLDPTSSSMHLLNPAHNLYLSTSNRQGLLYSYLGEAPPEPTLLGRRRTCCRLQQGWPWRCKCWPLLVCWTRFQETSHSLLRQDTFEIKKAGKKRNCQAFRRTESTQWLLQQLPDIHLRL